MELGNSAKPSNHWGAYQGSSYPAQFAEKLAPPRRIRITHVGAWIGGWNGQVRVALTIWDATSKAVLAQSVEVAVANKGAGGPSGGNVDRTYAALVAPIEIDVPFFAGWVRRSGDGGQYSMGSDSSGQHVEGKIGASAYPGAPLANTTLLNRRMGIWVEYADVAGAQVYRGGAWQRAQVTVRRGAVDTQAQRVAVWRNGAWVDGG